MNAKYILFLCLSMNYLVVQSVATKRKERKAIQHAYNKTIEHFHLNKGDKLTVYQLKWLLGDKLMIQNNFSPDEVAVWSQNGISLNKLYKITIKICKNFKQEVLEFMETINKRLADKTGSQELLRVLENNAIQQAYNKTIEHFHLNKGDKLTVYQLKWLLGDKLMIQNNFSPDEVAVWSQNSISCFKLQEIIRKICKNSEQEVLEFIKTINKQLTDKTSIKTIDV